MLSDLDITTEIYRGNLLVEPFKLTNLQAASIDLTLGSEFQVMPETTNEIIDVAKPVDHLFNRVQQSTDYPFVLTPGSFVLAHTEEVVNIPGNISARIEGKSSLARLGLVIHTTAGFIDPGFSGQVTLELKNLTPVPIKLYVGMKIGQISFQYLTTPSGTPYGNSMLSSKYQHQKGAAISKYFQNFTLTD